MSNAKASRAALGICVGLALLFVMLGYGAARTKSATYDEPLHVVGGVVHRFHGDYRLNPEDPALFGLYSSIPLSPSAVALDLDSADFQSIPQEVQRQWPFAVRSLYQTSGNNPDDSVLRRSRLMFLLLGAALAGMIAWWSGKLGGAVAAVVGAALYALDPNFLAHAALVKNDVMLSAVLFATTIAVWRFGKEGTALALLGICLGCAAAINLKFSGIVLAPFVVLLLLVRAVMPDDWAVVGFRLRTVRRRLLVPPAVAILALVVSWAATWAAYDFRFAPTPDGRLLDSQRMLKISKRRAFLVEQKKNPDPAQYRGKTADQLEEQIQARPLDPKLAALMAMQDARILPQAWLYGLIYTYTTSLTRSSFLCGSRSLTGWWYYFPATLVFKTPLATLGAMLLALALTIAAHSSTRARQLRVADAWSKTCLMLPPSIYALTAMTTNLNLGIRHILPIFPFIFVGIAISAASLRRARPRTAALVGGMLLASLAAESFTAFPDYLSFFNVASGGSRGGLRLLADSNLDWGQDIPALVQWQKERRRLHPDEPLYFAYSGTADPAFYGLDSVNFGAPERGFGWPWGPITREASTPGVMALSATVLQGVYGSADEFKDLREREPLEVLGGSIYLYEWPPRQGNAPP